VTGRDAEYDRFGPWVVEIGDEDPPPPLFLPHLTRTERALLSVKIPRKVTRREAHPGMDLYDYVVSLYEQDMVILERVEHDVRSRTIAYRDVRLLQIQEELLRGSIHLGVPEEPYDLPFNSVSSKTMRRLVDLVRDRYGRTSRSAAFTAPSPAIDELSFYFVRMLKAERQGGSEMQLLAAQPDRSLGSREAGLVRRILIGIVDKRLLESVHLSDGRELRVVDRGRPYAYRWQTVYGRRVTWIPIANITDIAWQDDAGHPAVATLVVKTSGGHGLWVFARDNPGLADYRELLAQLTG